MQIVIDIPKDFEEHFMQDRFEDSLHRLSADAHYIAGNYEQETAIMLIKAFQEAIVLPKGHGRLIDADVLWDKLSKYTDNEGAIMPFGDNDALIHRDSAMFIVENETTILEADKEA